MEYQRLMDMYNYVYKCITIIRSLLLFKNKITPTMDTKHYKL